MPSASGSAPRRGTIVNGSMKRRILGTPPVPSPLLRITARPSSKPIISWCAADRPVALLQLFIKQGPAEATRDLRRARARVQWPRVLSELRAQMTRSEAPSLLPCLRRRHFGDQCMLASDEASSLLGQGDDLAAATASAQVLAELLKRRAEACR